MRNKFQGVGVALVTPFRKYGSIDFTSLGKVVEHLIVNNVDYIVVLGTTGEVATLSADEKHAVVDFVLEAVNHRVPVVVGVGGNNTSAVINDLHALRDRSIDGILSVTPYYNKPQYRGLFNHYKNIASATDCPVILYNVPGRTGTNMTAELTLDLASSIDNIVAIKEASGNLTQIGKILRDKPKDFMVISGDDSLTLPMIAMGAEGVISVTANTLPKAFSEMVHLAMANRWEEARVLHYRLLPIMEGIFMEGSPGGVKALMEEQGIIQNHLRLPLVKVSKSTNVILKRLLVEFNEQIADAL